MISVLRLATLASLVICGSYGKDGLEDFEKIDSAGEDQEFIDEGWLSKSKEVLRTVDDYDGDKSNSFVDDFQRNDAKQLKLSVKYPAQNLQYPSRYPQYPSPNPHHSRLYPQYPSQNPQYPRPYPQYPPNQQYPRPYPQYPPNLQYPRPYPQYSSNQQYPRLYPQYPSPNPQYPVMYPQYPTLNLQHPPGNPRPLSANPHYRTQNPPIDRRSPSVNLLYNPIYPQNFRLNPLEPQNPLDRQFPPFNLPDPVPYIQNSLRNIALERHAHYVNPFSPFDNSRYSLLNTQRHPEKSNFPALPAQYYSPYEQYSTSDLQSLNPNTYRPVYQSHLSENQVLPNKKSEYPNPKNEQNSQPYPLHLVPAIVLPSSLYRFESLNPMQRSIDVENNTTDLVSNTTKLETELN